MQLLKQVNQISSQLEIKEAAKCITKQKSKKLLKSTDLSEIVTVPSHTYKRFQLSDFDLKNSTRIGYSEGDTVIIKALAFNSDEYIYALYSSQRQFLSGVVGRDVMHNGYHYFMIEDVYTPVDKRMQGYASALYKSLVKKYNIKLISDIEQTIYGKKLWASIGKVLDIKVWDSSTNRIIPRNQISDDDIYINHPDRYQLLAEHIPRGVELMEPRATKASVLLGYQVYTHKDNIGLYE